MPRHRPRITYRQLPFPLFVPFPSGFIPSHRDHRQQHCRPVKMITHIYALLKYPVCPISNDEPDLPSHVDQDRPPDHLRSTVTFSILPSNRNGTRTASAVARHRNHPAWAEIASGQLDLF